MTPNWNEILATMVETDKDPSEAIVGVFDSRMLAGAYWGTEIEGKERYDHLEFASPEIVRDYWSQEVDGIPRYVPPEEGVIEGRLVEVMLHQQIFSYHDPVQALEYVADRIPGLKEKTGVDVIVSKWDREKLAEYGVVGSGWDMADEYGGVDRAGLEDKNPGKVVEITLEFTRLYDPPAGFEQEAADLSRAAPPPLDTDWFNEGD